MFRSIFLILVFLTSFQLAAGQDTAIEFPVSKGRTIEIVNHFGKIDIRAFADSDTSLGKAYASSAGSVSNNEIKITNSRGNIILTASPDQRGKRIDLIIEIPERSRVKARTEDGEIRLQGNLELAQANSVTGTIAVDVPTADLRYNLRWLASRPRFLADFELPDMQERSGGRFEIKGSQKNSDQADRVTIDLTTERGIILLNVPPNEVTSDLRQRPLTEAAKAIIRSGDSLLIEAIRRSSPKHFGDYVNSLPPYRRPPELIERADALKRSKAGERSATIRIVDTDGRAVTGISADELEILEDGRPRDILSVREVNEPVNLVLLLDVSGSIENYVNFIRKSARSFVETVDPNDRISIVTFNDEVKVLSPFSNDKEKLSESLDSFDAGGGTAYYDALAYTLVESIAPLKGSRTAIVILTDGDDNRSFIPFDPLVSALMETGALVYPLYVPSSLVAASESNRANSNADPLRTRYMGLSARAEGEGERLAKASGGVYYPISQLSHIQAAYDDIANQLRSAYQVRYSSNIDIENSTGVSPRVRVRVKNSNLFANITSLSD